MTHATERKSLLLCAAAVCLASRLFGQTTLPPVVAPFVSTAQALIDKGDIDGGVTELQKAFAAAQDQETAGKVSVACLVLANGLFANKNTLAGEKLVDLTVVYHTAKSEDTQLELVLQIGAKLGESSKSRSTTLKYSQQLAAFYAKKQDVDHEQAILEQLLAGAQQGKTDDPPLEVLERLKQIYTDSKQFLELAGIRFALATMKERNGDVAQATAECEAAVKGIKEQGLDAAQVPTIFDQCALILRKNAKYALAKDYLDEAIKREKDPKELGPHQFNLALVYADLGQKEQAIEQAKTSVETVRGTKVRADLARVLAGAAGVYANAGHLTEAVEMLDEARVIAREDGLEDVKADALQKLAGVRSMQGKSPMAAANLNRGGEVGRNPNGEAPEKAVDWRRRGESLLTNGDAKAAVVILEGAVRRAEAQHEPEELAAARSRLAQAYAQTGDVTRAEPALLESLKFYEQRGDHREVEDTLRLLADLYVEMGRYYDALERYQRRETLLKEQAGGGSVGEQFDGELAEAEIYLHLRNFERALTTATEIAEKAAKAGFEDHAGRAERLAGRVCLAQQNFPAARMHFLNAEKFDYRGMAFDEGLVEVYLATRDFKSAVEELDKVKAENLQGAGDELQARFYTQRGQARMGTGDFNGGFQDLQKAMGLVDYARLDVMGRHSLGYLDAGAFGSRTRPHRAMMEKLASLQQFGLKDVFRLEGKPLPLAEGALHYSELARGRSLFDAVRAAREKELVARLPAALRAKQEQLLKDRERLAAEAKDLLKREALPTDEQRAAAARLQQQAAELLEETRKVVPEYDLEPGLPFVKKLALHDDEVMLEYAVERYRLLIFVVGKQGVTLLSTPFVVEDLTNEVNVFRKLLLAGRFSKERAEQLYQKLVGPADEYIKPGDKVVIVPDGFLDLLPFEALITSAPKEGEPPSFFGAKHQISYAESISAMALARLIAKPVGRKPLFAVADPIFDKSDGRYQPPPADVAAKTETGEIKLSPNDAAGGYPRLPDTKDEAEAVAALVGAKPESPDVLIGAAANKKRFTESDLSDYRYIHLATHAAALGDLGRVNEPFFVLGLPESGKFEDQIVRMSDVMKLKLAAELVVLAACETGRGDTLQGDGVASLASAFLYAGANNVLLSLWKVPSKASVLFMQKFYGYLREGKGESEALRLAKDAVRMEYPDPYYWAVYVLYEMGNASRQGKAN